MFLTSCVWNRHLTETQYVLHFMFGFMRFVSIPVERFPNVARFIRSPALGVSALSSRSNACRQINNLSREGFIFMGNTIEWHPLASRSSGALGDMVCIRQEAGWKWTREATCDTSGGQYPWVHYWLYSHDRKCWDILRIKQEARMSPS
jgi:hypothetical protein